MCLIKPFERCVVIHQILSEKSDIIDMVFDRFLGDTGVFQPGLKLRQEGLIGGMDGLYALIERDGVVHTTPRFVVWFYQVLGSASYDIRSATKRKSHPRAIMLATMQVQRVVPPGESVSWHVYDRGRPTPWCSA